MLRIEGLHVKYDTDYALRDVGFTLQKGERAALMGPNGAGKSTLLLALTGILPLAGGAVYGQDGPLTPKNLRIWRQQVGLLFQNPDDQLFMPTVAEDIAFGPRQNGITEAETARRMRDVMERLQITHLHSRMTHKLSGGEKRLVALAGLLVLTPEVLLMDEPTAFLDPRAARRLAEMLGKLPQTLLIATHDTAWAQTVCDRALLMKNGTLLADAPFSEAIHNQALLDECGL